MTGTSMLPAFQPGDRILVAHPALIRPFAPRSHRVRPGDVVTFYDPRWSPGSPDAKVLLKRVHSVRDGEVDLRGDNPIASTDSRHFGTVAAPEVSGIAFYRYYPAHRVAWWPGRSTTGRGPGPPAGCA